MNTHEHFRNSQSRTFLACHFYSRLFFFSFFSNPFWKWNTTNNHWSMLYIFFPQKHLLMPSELTFELEMSDWLTVWIDSIDALPWINLYYCETQVPKKTSNTLDLVGVSYSFPVLKLFQKQRAISVSWQKIARKWNTKLE